MEKLKEKANLIGEIDSRTKLLALICIVIDGGLIAALPFLEPSDRLPAFGMCVLILVIMVAGILWIEKNNEAYPKIEEFSNSVSSLESNVSHLFKGANVRYSFKGYLINSGRFIDRYSDYETRKGLKLGRIKLLMPSSSAIELAYKNKDTDKKDYLISTIKAYRKQWEDLAHSGHIEDIEIRYVNAFPSSLYIIRDTNTFVTGLYEPNSAHAVGFTCTSSWLGNSETDVKSYIEWFDSTWNDSLENDDEFTK